MDKELLRYLWMNLIPTDNHKLLCEVARIFVEFFEIGYVVDRADGSGRVSAMSILSDRSAPTTPSIAAPSTNGQRPVSSIKSGNRTKSRDSIIPTETPDNYMAFNISRILIPWLRNTLPPPKFREEYERFVHNANLVANFRFPRHIPAGFFETLTVRAQREHLGFTTLYHWKGGLYAQHQEHPTRLYLLRIHHEGDNSTCMRMEMRLEHQTNEDRDIETLWMALLPFLRETDNLLSKFTGTYRSQF